MFLFDVFDMNDSLDITEDPIPSTPIEDATLGTGSETFSSQSCNSEYTSSPSFCGNSHIDSLYDPHITDAKEDFVHHLDDYDRADTLSEAENAANAMRQDINSQKYWEDAKHEAEIQSQKNQAFHDYIDGMNDILEKYKDY